MAGPWEKYAAPATTTQAAGPWAQYAAAEPVTSSGIPGMPGRVPSARDRAREAEMAAESRTAADDNLLGKIVGPVDAGLTLLSGMAAGAIAPIGGFIKSAISGGRPEDNMNQIAGSIARAPVTGTGTQLAKMAGDVLAPLGTLPTATMAQGAQAAASGAAGLRGLAGASAAAQGAQDAAMAAGATGKLRDLVRAPSQLSGVGAANVSQATQRAQRAAALPVPIKLTKGQLTRDRQQVAFERETAKQEDGAPLASAYEDQNAAFMQNLDAGVDIAGATATNRRSVGQSVVGAIGAKEKEVLTRVNGLYNEARAAGEMGQPVDVTALTNWITKNKGKDRLAPIITAIENELKQNGKIEGGGLDNLTLTQRPTRTVMTLDASEDLRQAINKLAEPGTPNVVFGKEAKKLIDAAQEGKGGEKFQQARRAYENYANEFKNRDVVDRLLRTKPGTKDRAVALEDVADRSIISPATSADDVRHMFRVLEAHPAGADAATVAAGRQAAKDLRGSVISHIKDEMEKSLNVDSRGARTGSPAKIDAVVRELDKDGKLDVIFGKKDAEKIRDLRDVAIDIYTSPSGTVNSSNTSSALIRKLESIGNYATATPFVGKAIKYTGERIQAAGTRRKVRDAVNPKLSDLKGGD